MSGIIGSRLNHRGSGLVGSLGTDGQIFTSAGAGAGAVYEDAAAGGGITSAVQWRVNTQFDGRAVPITANWEQVDGWGNIGDTVGNVADTALLGSNVSQSSGVFTFPTTGIWYITFNITMDEANNVIKQIIGSIHTTVDGASNWQMGSKCQGHVAGENYTSSWVAVNLVFDVESTANYKVRFNIDDDGENVVTVLADTNTNRTYASFIRLGDT